MAIRVMLNQKKIQVLINVAGQTKDKQVNDGLNLEVNEKTLQYCQSLHLFNLTFSLCLTKIVLHFFFCY